MIETQKGTNNDWWTRDITVGPVEITLSWSFPHVFQVSGRLRCFGYKCVSTFRTYAICIFSTTGITTIDNRDAGVQVSTPSKDKQFLYTQGNGRPMERYISGVIASSRVVSFLFHLTKSELFHRHFAASFCSLSPRSMLVATRGQRMSVV